MEDNKEDKKTVERIATRTPLQKSLKFQRSYHITISEMVECAKGRDISSAGIGFTTNEMLQTGSVVKVYVPVGEQGTEVPVLAEVVWSEAAGEMFRVGVRFLS